MLILQNISYSHPNKDLLFDKISLTVASHEKIALIGNNGVGKSTLLKIIADELKPFEGQISADSKPYYIPQIFGQYNHLSVSEALGIAHKLNALKEILAGQLTVENYDSLGDDWSIEERCTEALKYWKITDLDLTKKMQTLSGGQKTKVFLAGISIHQPELVLLDEPSNHLDISGRVLLYDFIQSTQSTLIVVSHDRKLLNLLSPICELGKSGIRTYGGNFDFFANQKQIENAAINDNLLGKSKALRKAKEKEREISERKQKLDARGKRKNEKAGVARIMMNALKNSAENSTSKIKNIHAEKISDISKDLHALRSALPDIDKIKFGFDRSPLHKGKIIFSANAVNFAYSTQAIWMKSLNLQIKSGERIALEGVNGSGKTTLIKLILGYIAPQTGSVYRAETESIYIDQEYSLINSSLSVYEQAQSVNVSALQEHEIKIRLNRFLFTSDDWGKPCSILSGGEKMRLMLACIIIHNQSPDLIILDEPTNNLDIQNIEILTAAINEYDGTLMVVSHDEYFLKQVNLERTIQLP